MYFDLQHEGGCGDGVQSHVHVMEAGRRTRPVRYLSGACCAGKPPCTRTHPSPNPVPVHSIAHQLMSGVPRVTAPQESSLGPRAIVPKFSVGELVRTSFGVPARSTADLVVRDVMYGCGW